MIDSNTNPLFSVVIPTYNRLGLCIESLTSVLEQSFSDYEILIIDDGSTDGTREYFSDYCHPKLTYVFQKNSGVSTARNLGISYSKGQYICYLDSDDIWHKDKLREVKNLILTQPSADILFHDFRKHDLKLEAPYDKTNTDIFPYIFDYFERQGDNDTWIGDKNASFELVMRGYPFYPSVVTIKREVHNQYLWDPGVLKSEDFNLILKLSLRYTFAYLDIDLTTIKIHDSNKSADMLTKDKIILNTMKTIAELYCSDEKKEISKRFLAVRKFYAGLSHIKRRNFLIGAKWIASSLMSRHFYLVKFDNFLKKH